MNDRNLSELSNFLYLLVPVVAALVGLEPIDVLGLAVGWGSLTFFSFYGHVKETDFWWEMDVTGVIMATASIGCAAIISPLAWTVLPLVGVLQYTLDPPTNYSVGLTALFSLVAGGAVIGLAALAPFGLFLAAVFIRKFVAQTEGPWHVVWHILTFLAGTLFVVLL